MLYASTFNTSTYTPYILRYHSYTSKLATLARTGVLTPTFVVTYYTSLAGLFCTIPLFSFPLFWQLDPLVVSYASDGTGTSDALKNRGRFIPFIPYFIVSCWRGGSGWTFAVIELMFERIGSGVCR